MIKSEIVAHSTNIQGDELISVLCTFPRIILAEVNTHRMLSKNTSSSRAIPFNKMVESVENDSFIPIAWQKEHSGMQGSEYLIDAKDISDAQSVWLSARDEAVSQAILLSKNEGVTKQLCNRLLEPFMWTTMLITGSKEGWDNFFKLRNPVYRYNDILTFKSKKDYITYSKLQGYPQNENMFSQLEWFNINEGQAEIHIMDLAEKIWDAKNESTPILLEAEEWHIPFENKIGRFANIPLTSEVSDKQVEKNILINTVKISVALAARTSYTVVGEEKEIDYQKMIDLHDRLLAQDPPHSSPLEHCCKALTNEEYYTFNKGCATNADDIGEGLIFESHSQGWVNNIKGFMPYRYIVDNSLSL